MYSPLPGAPICCRQITFPMDLPRNLQNRKGSEARTGSLPAEGHSDAQVSMHGSVGQQFFKNWSNGESFCLLTPREEDSIIPL